MRKGKNSNLHRMCDRNQCLLLPTREKHTWCALLMHQGVVTNGKKGGGKQNESEERTGQRNSSIHPRCMYSFYAFVSCFAPLTFSHVQIPFAHACPCLHRTPGSAEHVTQDPSTRTERMNMANTTLVKSVLKLHETPMRPPASKSRFVDTRHRTKRW